MDEILETIICEFPDLLKLEELFKELEDVLVRGRWIIDEKMSKLEDLSTDLLVPSFFTLVFEFPCEVFEIHGFAESFSDVSKSYSIDVWREAFV